MRKVVAVTILTLIALMITTSESHEASARFDQDQIDIPIGAESDAHSMALEVAESAFCAEYDDLPAIATIAGSGESDALSASTPNPPCKKRRYCKQWEWIYYGPDIGWKKKCRSWGTRCE